MWGGSFSRPHHDAFTPSSEQLTPVVFHFHRLSSGVEAQTWLTGRSASSRSRGGSGKCGSKLLRRRHGDSSGYVTVVAAVTLPGASPAGTGVLAHGCDWAVAAGS